MNIFQLVIRWFLRLKWWFLALPIFVTLIAVYFTKNLNLQYKTEITIFTGVISNYGGDPGQSNGGQDWNFLNNSINNITNTIRSKETLKRLSLMLYARVMIHGNPNVDNSYIKAVHYRELYDITPKDVLKLIDKKSVEKTVENLLKYEKPERNNFVYGLINWNHPYFSYAIINENLKIYRVDNSDILQVSYETNDPGIAYQTLQILSDIFGNEYRKLQFSNTNNVIKYFEDELAGLARELRGQEDSLTLYNMQNRVINYDKQTEALAFLDKEFSLRAQEVLFAFNNTRAAVQELESRLDLNTKAIKNNSEFLHKLQNISAMNYSLSQARTAGLDSLMVGKDQYINNLSKDLKKGETEFRDFMQQYSAQKYTRDGYPNSNYVAQWVDELLKFKKAEAELQVVKDFQADIDSKYTKYSPIGSVLKRKERSINFTEQSYLAILRSLNEARLRLKSLEMNSAVLKVINPASFPLNSLPSKRKIIVAGAYFGTLILLFGFFLLLELLDRTIRDKMRTERLIRAKVIGAFPKANIFKNKQLIEQKIVHVLANNLYGLYRHDLPYNLINVITLRPLPKAHYISEMLSSYWQNIGINVRAFHEGADFKVDSRAYLIEQSWKEVFKAYDISLVQHGPLFQSLIPTAFLQEGIACLVLMEADSLFNVEDEMMLNNLRERMDGKPVLICLVDAKKYVIEEFTGLLPPYTFIRKLGYRLANFGLTSRS